MSCFAYRDIIPNSCFLLAQSPQEKASFPYSTLRVPRVFFSWRKNKNKNDDVNNYPLFRKKVFPCSWIEDVNCGNMHHRIHFQTFSPGVSVPKEHRTILRSSKVWEMMWGSGFPSVPQFPSWSLLCVSPLPGPTLRNINPQTFQVDLRSLVDVEIAQTPHELSQSIPRWCPLSWQEQEPRIPDIPSSPCVLQLPLTALPRSSD